MVPTLSRLTVGRVLALTGLWAYLTAWAFEADGGEDSASPSPSRLVRITVGISVLAICASVIAIFEPPRYDCVFGMITFGELWRALLATASWCMFAGTGLSHLQILELAVFGGCAGLALYLDRTSDVLGRRRPGIDRRRRAISDISDDEDWVPVGHPPGPWSDDSGMDGTLADSDDEDGEMANHVNMFTDPAAAGPLPAWGWPPGGTTELYPDILVYARGQVLVHGTPGGVATINLARANLPGYAHPHGGIFLPPPPPPPPPPHWPPRLRFDLDELTAAGGGGTGCATRAARRRQETDVQRAPPPHECICPISRDVMCLPAITPMGTTYDWDTLVHWVHLHGTYPMDESRRPLHVSELVPNLALRNIIEDWATDSRAATASAAAPAAGAKPGTMPGAAGTSGARVRGSARRRGHPATAEGPASTGAAAPSSRLASSRGQGGGGGGGFAGSSTGRNGGSAGGGAVGAPARARRSPARRSSTG